MAKFLVPIIQDKIEENNIDTYIELMVGGANLIDKIECKHKIGCDINHNLISLLKYVQTDNSISIAPSECTFEHYADVRSNQTTGKYSDEYVALIGYCASYGGRYFDGGYGRDSKGGRSIYTERVSNLREQAPRLNDIKFQCCSFEDFDTSKYENALFYFDPPYKGTKTYGKQKFDYEKFYDFCRELSKKNTVLISEYNMPDDFECIWEKERTVLQKSDRVKGEKAVEKLFTVHKK